MQGKCEPRASGEGVRCSHTVVSAPSVEHPTCCLGALTRRVVGAGRCGHRASEKGRLLNFSNVFDTQAVSRAAHLLLQGVDGVVELGLQEGARPLRLVRRPPGVLLAILLLVILVLQGSQPI